MFNAVAPARERGLKSPALQLRDESHLGRSREGAWIEITNLNYQNRAQIGSLPRGSVD